MKDKILVVGPFLGIGSHMLFGHIDHEYPSDAEFLMALEKVHHIAHRLDNPCDKEEILHPIEIAKSNLLKMRDALSALSLSAEELGQLFIDDFTKVEPLELGQFIVTDTQICKPTPKGIPWNPRKSKKIK